MRKIIIDPDICNGQPVIEGTRITASTVLEFLSAGDTIDDVLACSDAVAAANDRR